MSKISILDKNRGPISIILSVVLSVLFVATAVQAATTISSNINTGGTLTVTGAQTLTGLTSMVQASSTRLSVFDTAYFGGSATSTFNSAGTLTMAANILSDTDSTDNLGLTGMRWASTFSDNFTGNTITLDGATGVNIFTITDNVADALSIIDSSGDLLVLDTRTGVEVFAVTPNSTFAGTLGVTGILTLNSNATVPNGYGLDVASSGALNIGTTSATAINIGSTGGATVVGGLLTIPAAYSLDTATAGALNIGTTTATSINYGGSSVTAQTFTTDGTGTAEIVLPTGSIDSTELLDGTVAKADMSTAFITIGNLADGTSGWVPDALATSFTITADASVVGANSVISVSLGANTTAAACSVSTRTAATSFVVACSAAPDDLATLQYMIVN